MTPVPLAPHPDRLLPVDPGVRALARRLYEEVRDRPIISPHGHADPRLLLDNGPFPDPATLLITPDHYVTRLLHASGVPLDLLGVGQGDLDESESRAVWRELCSHWDVYRGTASRYWLESELADIFGVTLRPFTGRSTELATDLGGQDGLYTLVTRAADGDQFQVLGTLAAVHAGTDHDAWLAYARSSDLAVVTITVTEAGYVLAPDSGGVDTIDPRIVEDAEALRADLTAPVFTVPARLVAALAARQRAGRWSDRDRVLRQPAPQRRGHRHGRAGLRADGGPRAGVRDRGHGVLRHHDGGPDHPATCSSRSLPTAPRCSQSGCCPPFPRSGRKAGCRRAQPESSRRGSPTCGDWEHR